MVRVLFVCMGNICRSPLAQGVFEDLVRREGLEGEISVDSAETHSYHIGKAPGPRAQESARRRGLDLGPQRARRITPGDCEEFDYVLTMDEENYWTVTGLCREGSAVVQPLLNYAPDCAETEVPDPYFGGEKGFELVIDLVEAASRGLLEDIRGCHLQSRV